MARGLEHRPERSLDPASAPFVYAYSYGSSFFGRKEMGALVKGLRIDDHSTKIPQKNDSGQYCDKTGLISKIFFY